MNKMMCVLIACMTLTACDQSSKEDQHAKVVAMVEMRTDDIQPQTLVDQGTVPVPGRPGFALHHYANVIGTCDQCYSNIHHIYILEKDGVPVGGADTTYPSGKRSAKISVQ